MRRIQLFFEYDCKCRHNDGDALFLAVFDQAQKLVGSTILVRDEDRPVLEEGEFYTHDLIGMRVILKVCGFSISSFVLKLFEDCRKDVLWSV